MKLHSWRKQDQIDLLNPAMLQALNRDVLERLVYNEAEAKAASNTLQIYDRMVTTYEKEFLPRASRAAKRNGIAGWERRR